MLIIQTNLSVKQVFDILSTSYYISKCQNIFTKTFPRNDKNPCLTFNTRVKVILTIT